MPSIHSSKDTGRIVSCIDSSVTQQIVKKGGVLRVKDGSLELVNPSASRDSSFEEVESKKKGSFLFGWIGGDDDLTSKKDD